MEMSEFWCEIDCNVVSPKLSAVKVNQSIDNIDIFVISLKVSVMKNDLKNDVDSFPVLVDDRTVKLSVVECRLSSSSRSLLKQSCYILTIYGHV